MHLDENADFAMQYAGNEVNIMRKLYTVGKFLT